MARDNEKFVKTWLDRIDKGIKCKKAWEETYDVPRCKRYWKGQQLEEPLDEFGNRRVQINRVHPSVRAALPSLYFNEPFVRIQVSPALSDTPGQEPGKSIDDRAMLLQDLGNTFVRDLQTNFDISTHLAVKEAQWAFGCIKVMYDAEPVDNPRAAAPPLKEDKDTPTGKKEPEKRYGDILGLAEDHVVGSEQFYVKRIPARQVVVSADQTGVIDEMPWVGYWSLHYLEDVKRSKMYKNVANLKASAVRTGEDDEEKSDGYSKQGSDKIKLYHIWDKRAKRYYVFADGQDGHDGPLYDVKFKRCPLKFLRFDIDPDEFYPLPPIYHELHPQDETNDSREWLRLNRKGTVPRYTYDEDAVDPMEMKKLESGDMGTYVKRKGGTHQVIEPIQQPNYSQVAMQTLGLSEKEFNELSMTAGEQRGVAASDTATQAKIIDVRSQVKESYDRTIVSVFLAEIVQEMILLAIDKMTLDKWILLNADPSAAGFPLEAENIADMYQQITHADLVEASEGVAWRVKIDPGSMSPVAEQEERQEWMQTLSLIGNPVMSRLLSVSPELRKKTFSLHGIKSAREQELIGEALQQLVQMEREMAQMGGPAPPGVASQPGAPPGMGGPGPRPGPPGPPPGGPGAPPVGRPPGPPPMAGRPGPVRIPA